MPEMADLIGSLILMAFLAVVGVGYGVLAILPKQARNKSVVASVRKHRRELFKVCEVPRRARYRFTAYVSSTGQVVSAGAVTKPGASEEKVPCLIEELSKLQLPKQKQMAKVEFDLR